MKYHKIIFLFIFGILVTSCASVGLKNSNFETDLIIEEIIHSNDFHAKKTDLNKNRLVNSLMESSIDFKNVDEKEFENYFSHIGPNGKGDSNQEKFFKF